jgi:hypothetical protein
MKDEKDIGSNLKQCRNPVKKTIINNKNIAILFNNIIGSIAQKTKKVITNNKIKKSRRKSNLFFNLQ